MQARTIAAALIVSAGVIASASAQDVPRTNCDSTAWRFHTKEGEDAVGPGPFRLVALHCQTLLNGRKPQPLFSPMYSPLEPVVVSPDISWIAAVNARDMHNSGVAAGPLSEPLVKVIHGDALETFTSWVAYAPFAPRKTMRWSADSRTLWSAMQEVATCPCPGSWAVKPPVGPVRPVAVENGVVRELPRLSHPAGTLDALLWADDGRALALFGARGRWYRPEVPNPNPVIALVDVARGRVVESLSLREEPFSDQVILSAEVAGLRDGRLRAFLRTGTSWIVWSEGAPPKILRDPYPGEDDWNRGMETAISADGTRLLVVRLNYRRVRECVGPPHEHCTLATVDGPLAAFHDLETGRAIWTLRVPSFDSMEPPGPVLSDDGRYALIGRPRSSGDRYYSIALISTSDGSVQQVFRTSGYKVTMGFGRGSQRMWIHDRGLTAVYALQ